MEHDGDGDAPVQVFEHSMKIPDPFPLDLGLTTVMPRPDAYGA
ncbi:hypothetical protein [Streptomyces sp. NPDC059134]